MTLVYGFELLDEQEISELNTIARVYRHALTGARLLSMENDDENKVFGVAFRTPPEDSTGVAHIMEHCVLCGSQKYPLKEPFIELVKGSLNTFLNAFTSPDKTTYPLASQNLQDFYNLIDVYMDAVFHPLIQEHSLQQEGWHYELDSLDDPLTYKGVVFNEMKGVYSDPDEMLSEYVRISLFPDNAYRVDYGGDPRAIPNLTYAQFQDFHARYYHPSNAYLYFYGDDDPQERLRLMDGYLQGYRAIQVASSIALQPAFSQPRQQVVGFDPGEDVDNRKGMLVMNWLLPENGDPQTMLSLQILEHILIGTPASPLRKALIDSDLGEDLVGEGVNTQVRQAYFSTGLKGMVVDETNQLLYGDRLQALILETLAELAERGIESDTVAASLNTVEFNLRENNTGSFPRGLSLLFRALTTWLYDGDPIAPLAFDAPLAVIKARLASGEAYFENLIREYFLENSHHTTVIMQPELGLTQQEDAAERSRLDQARAAMSQADLQTLVENTRRLKEIQATPDSPEALATIPVLTLDDLDKENKFIPLEVSEQAGCGVLYHDLFTNGILYLDVGMNLFTLSQDLLPYVPLFSRALLEIGTETEDFVKLSQRIGRWTGGISPATFASQVRGEDRSVAWLFLRGKATVENVQQLLNIIKDVLLTVRLDNQARFHQMALEEKAEMESMLAPYGHRVVNNRLRALFNQADWAAEQMGGVSYLLFLRELVQAVENDWPGVVAKLEMVRAALINRSSMICNVTLDAANLAQFQPRLAEFLGFLPSAPVQLASWQPSAAARFEGLTIPAQVNFVGKGANLYKLGYQMHGSVNVITKYLATTWLWERVRIQGGAYGGFCLFNHRSGVFTYLSYRDPNLLGTLENYDSTGQFLVHLKLNQDELTKVIIGAIGDMDAYQLPDAKGYTSLLRYLTGDDDDARQLWREQVLGTQLRDFHAFGEVLERAKETWPVIVLGLPETLSAANAERGDFLKITKLM